MGKVTDRNDLIIVGMLGSILYATSDWIMMYGDPTSLSAKSSWFTKGTAQISDWRYILAMILSYPGTILYAIGLFSFERYIPQEKHKKMFHCLNIINLTTWMTLHLIFIIIIYAFHFMMTNGYSDVAIPISEALYTHFSWILPMSFLYMFPFFIYFFILIVTGRTTFKRKMGFAYMFPIAIISFIIAGILPDSAFKKGFINAAVNQSIFISFFIFYLHSYFISISGKKTKPSKKK